MELQLSVRRQTTLRAPIFETGPTVFSGETSEVRIFPAPEDHGIVFVSEGVEIPAHIDFVNTSQPGKTSLESKGVSLSMVEHLLAAFKGIGLTNARIEVKGSEIPMCDGSAQSWVHSIESVGIIEQGAQVKSASLESPVYWMGASARLVALPAEKFRITYVWHAPDSIKFRSGFWEGDITPASFKKQLANARTFGFRKEIEQAQKLGLIRAPSLERGILIDSDIIVNPEGLRWDDEIVRHKVLDVIGDLSLIGLDIPMHIIAVRSGHIGNLALARSIVQLLRSQDPHVPKTYTRCKTDCEDTPAPLSISADR